MKKQWDTGVYTGSCESGEDKRATMASQDAFIHKYRYYYAEWSLWHLELKEEDVTNFKENFLSLHYPQGNY